MVFVYFLAATVPFVITILALQLYWSLEDQEQLKEDNARLLLSEEKMKKAFRNFEVAAGKLIDAYKYQIQCKDDALNAYLIYAEELKKAMLAFEKVALDWQGIAHSYEEAYNKLLANKVVRPAAQSTDKKLLN